MNRWTCPECKMVFPEGSMEAFITHCEEQHNLDISLQYMDGDKMNEEVHALVDHFEKRNLNPIMAYAVARVYNESIPHDLFCGAKDQVDEQVARAFGRRNP